MFFSIVTMIGRWPAILIMPFALVPAVFALVAASRASDNSAVWRLYLEHRARYLEEFPHPDDRNPGQFTRQFGERASAGSFKDVQDPQFQRAVHRAQALMSLADVLVNASGITITALLVVAALLALFVVLVP